MSENDTKPVATGQIVISQRVYVPLLALIFGAGGAYAVVKLTAPPLPPFPADDPYRAAYYRQQPLAPQAPPPYYQPQPQQPPVLPQAAPTPSPAPQTALTSPPPQAPAAPTYTNDPTVVKEVADRIVPPLMTLDAVTTPGPNGETENPIIIVYDPHCPYCHKAFEALRGKAPIRWIPVAILADPDDAIAQANAVLDEERKTPGAGAEAMKKAFDKTLTYSRSDVSPTTKESIQKNIMSFVALYTGRDPRTAGVPTVLVPRRDGSLYFSVGFQPGDDVKLLGLYRN